MRRYRQIAGWVALLMGWLACAAQTPSPWAQPAEALAEQVAGIIGPGQAHLTIRNLSGISVDAIPPIRRLLEEDLKARGVQASGAESANTIRVTLSENMRERLWVAEIVEGNETRVTMVAIPAFPSQTSIDPLRMVLHKEPFAGPYVLDSLPCFSSPDGKPPLLAVAEMPHGLLVLKQGCVLALDRKQAGFSDGRSFNDVASAHTRTRDQRGMIVPVGGDDGFLVLLPGVQCAGSYAASPDADRPPGEGWSMQCHASDDPWPISNSGGADGAANIKAFYNAARNYFTGVVTPSVGVDLPAFYSAALIPRADGAGLLIGGIDGKVQLAAQNALKPIAGTRDWGSDFGVLHSGCGTGTQVIVSGSGDAAIDSLRAYELPGLEAVPASEPVAMDGTVTELSTALDGKSVLAVVRKGGGAGHADEYEVDRVTATCN